MPASTARLSRSPLRLAYAGRRPAAAPAETIALGVLWLAGAVADGIFRDAVPAGTEAGLRLFRADGLLIGYGAAPFVAGDLKRTARDLYLRVLAACGGRPLQRVWNYVPRINAATAGLENYRAFCLGRSLAFEEGFGAEFQGQLSAASAVGSGGDRLELVFVAGAKPPRHVENPAQVPAYCYPAEHGPRAPSFARATIGRGATRVYTFVSGTAAIKGHATVAPGALAEQLTCTFDNLRLISRAVGAGERLDAGPGGERHFKVYLRDAGDLAAVRTRFRREWLEPSDRVTYLRADICRAELKVEIEATLVRPAGRG